jgi:acyl-CoA synthetase (AMP-forming)/AMP-acid ligase II
MSAYLCHQIETHFADVLRARAADRPEGIAFRFLVDGDNEGPPLTFGELQRQARAIARSLRRAAGPGERVLLVYPPGLEFIAAIFGCFEAGVTAVPTYPPRPERVLQGTQLIAGIARDCRPAVVLTGGTGAPLLQQVCGGIAELQGIPWINTDLLAPVSDEGRGADPAADDVALLQYTSGSTGDPKGVMVTHRNLLHNERMIQLAFCHHEYLEYGAGVCWLPPYHDMGLLGNVLHAVFIGAPSVLMSPLGMLQRPLRWLEAISRYRASTSGGPNFAYDLCAARATPEQLKQLDLSNWSIAAVGAEPVRAETLDRFARAFEPSGFRRESFYPCYGLAEATLFVSGGAKAAVPVVKEFPLNSEDDRRCSDSQRLVGCGHAWLDQQIEIVDPETLRRCHPGETGEIWVSGPSVAAGYWGRREETQSAFHATVPGGHAGRFLRTGDLGFFDGGELFVAGRLKDVIIIRGRNYLPHDIETTVQSVHPALRADSGAAFGVEVRGEERLVVVQEIDRQTRALDLQALRWEIRKAISRRYELQLHDVVFLRNGTLPKTTSGKVRRQACKAGYLSGTLTHWRPRTERGTIRE